MRNYSVVVPQVNTRHWFADKKMDAYELSQVFDVFNLLFENPMGTTYKQLTSSEQRVISSFLRYARLCRKRRNDYVSDHPGSFVYVNMNTGVTMVWITWYGFGEFAGNTSYKVG